MAQITVIERREATCIDCGAAGDLTVYGGTNTAWTDEYDERGHQQQHTERLSEGFSFECRSCGYTDGEPPQA